MEPRAGPERGHKPFRPMRELEVTFSSTYSRWTEPFHLIVILSSNSTDLPKKTPRQFLQDPLVDQRRWSELSFASSAFTVAPVPSQLLPHRHRLVERTRLEQPTTTRCEICQSLCSRTYTGDILEMDLWHGQFYLSYKLCAERCE